MTAADLFSERKLQRYQIEPDDIVERVSVADFHIAEQTVHFADIKMKKRQSVTRVFPYGTVWTALEQPL